MSVVDWMEGYGGAILIASSCPAFKQRRLRYISENKPVTNSFSALEVGQLVKDEYFTLFESIGAIEVRAFHSSPEVSFRLSYLHVRTDYGS
jgi:hypothetical protein